MDPENEIITEEVKYARSIEKELKKNLKLLNNETIELDSNIFIFSGKLTKQNPGVVMVSNKRLIFFCHRFFGADQLTYIPFARIIKANFSSMGGLRMGIKAIEITYGDQIISFGIASYKGRTSNEDTSQFFEEIKKKIPNQLME